MTLPALSLLWSLSLSTLVGPAGFQAGSPARVVEVSVPQTTETVVLGGRAVFPSRLEVLSLLTLSTASDPGDFPFFYPRSQTYELELRVLPLPGLALSLRHSCTHPVLSSCTESNPGVTSSSTCLTVSIGSPSLLRGPRP
jgi:hypothetical protein